MPSSSRLGSGTCSTRSRPAAAAEPVSPSARLPSPRRCRPSSPASATPSTRPSPGCLRAASGRGRGCSGSRWGRLPLARCPRGRSSCCTRTSRAPSTTRRRRCCAAPASRCSTCTPRAAPTPRRLPTACTTPAPSRAATRSACCGSCCQAAEERRAHVSRDEIRASARGRGGEREEQEALREHGVAGTWSVYPLLRPSSVLQCALRAPSTAPSPPP
mmetsp:Transcript_7423/g.23691  ORF Transcript_7423/g.23691 Transcript_7423/m.23691 type:complete len:216 (+) Transcript_7423:649-1296(+)